MTMNDFVKKMLVAQKINFHEGVFEMFGVRGFIIPTKTGRTFLEKLYEQLGEDVFELLFESGQEQGRQAVTAMQEKFELSKETFLKEINDSFNIMGLGELTMEEFDQDEHRIVFTLTNSPAVEEFKSSDVFQDVECPVDVLQRGIMHGMAAAFFGVPMTSEETHCEFLGDEQCRFVIAAEE